MSAPTYQELALAIVTYATTERAQKAWVRANPRAVERDPRLQREWSLLCFAARQNEGVLDDLAHRICDARAGASWESSDPSEVEAARRAMDHAPVEGVGVEVREDDFADDGESPVCARTVTEAVRRSEKRTNGGQTDG